MHQRFVIASRESRLALWQAEHVQSLIQKNFPTIPCDILGMTTQGDRILDVTLSKIGGKGLFVKELQKALLDREAEFAVHSLKDVPVQESESFRLLAVLARANPFDAFVSNHYESLEQLPPNAIVGTSSLRRESQLRALFPHLHIRSLRGNLDTRLGKLDAGEYDAIILAAAGLERLGLTSRIRQIISADICLPAVGQGVLGIEVLAARADELWPVVSRLHDTSTFQCILAERAVSRVLGGSCQIPIAAYAVPEPQDTLYVKALVASPDGQQILRAEVRGSANQAEALGHTVGQQLLSQGADVIIQSLLN